MKATKPDVPFVHRVTIKPDFKKKEEYNNWLYNEFLPDLYSKGNLSLIIQDKEGQITEYGQA